MSEQFPDHWTSRRLKRAVDLVNDRTDTGTGSYVGLEHIESWTGRLLDSAVEDESGGATSRFQPGDILFGKLRPYLAKVVHAQVWGCCSPELLVLRPRIHDPHYLQYVLLTDEFIHRVNATTYGSKMPRANWADIGDLVIPVPSMSDQRAIADFLDEKTAAIDALIAKKERLIDLIEEKRQATITRAVTKGLDPDVPMKDSGIGWLGEIPDAWEIRRLKYIVDFCGGGTPSKDEETFWDGDIPWVSPKDMRTSVILDSEDHITEDAVRARATREVPAGSVLVVVRSGILRHSIPVAIAGRPVTLNQDMKALIPHSRIESRYLRYVIHGRQHALLLAWRKAGATVESIEHELLANTAFPVPPYADQRAIADFLDEKTGATDALNTKQRKLIEKLREYRQTLISAAVTGQIDVRFRAGRTENVLEEALA